MREFLSKKAKYVFLRTRRQGRQAFSSREALSLIMLAGLPFLFISSLYVNQSVNSNVAYAYTHSEAIAERDIGSADRARLIRYKTATLLEDPERLEGTRKEDVLLLLDEPGLMRAEKNFAQWQYRSPSCVIDLFIEGTGDLSRVVHYEMRSRGTDAQTDITDIEARVSCLKTVLKYHDGSNSPAG